MISLLKFFIGNSFQFWKLPPGLCINNMDNVYYPVFLTGNDFHFFIEKWQKLVLNIAGYEQRTDVLLGYFFVGKARERVFSLYLSTAPFNLSTA